MSIPWTLRPYQFSAVAGEETVIPLKVPSRGTINSLRIDDLDSPTDAATFDIVTLQAAAYAEEKGSLSLNMPGETGKQYSVLGGPQAMTGGFYAAENLLRGYRNLDGTYSVPVRLLYLVIKPAGTGTHNYAITMTIFMPEIG